MRCEEWKRVKCNFFKGRDYAGIVKIGFFESLASGHRNIGVFKEDWST